MEKQKEQKNKKSEAGESDSPPLNKSRGITTAFYVREDNIKLLEDEQMKQNRSLSWLVNHAIEKYYGDK